MAEAFMAPGAFDADAEAIRRRQAYAQALMQQGGQMPQGGMVGNHYVAPSWTQGLANALKMYMGRKQEDQAGTDMQALDTRRRSEMMDDASAFSAALRGTPAQTAFDVPANEMGDQFTMNPTAEKKPDPNEALRVALQSRNPMLNAMGGKIMESQLSSILPKATKWKLGERYNEKTGMQEKFMYDENNPANQQAVGGQQAVKNEFVNGQAVNPYTAAPAAAPAIPLQESKPSDQKLYELAQKEGYKGTFTQWDNQRRKAAASNQSVSVNTATKPFLSEIGQGVGKQVIDDYGGARSAQQTLNNVQQIEGALSKVIVGPTAGVRVKLSQIGEILGVNGKDATEKLENTRNVIQGLARQELAAAGQMKGQGQITESERGILRRAESGDVSELTVPEIKTLMGALKKTSNYRIGIHNENLGRLQKDPNAAGVVDYMRLPGGGAQPASGGGFEILKVTP